MKPETGEKPSPPSAVQLKGAQVAARETTRGLSFNPNVAKRQREARRAFEAQERERQEDQSYDEHFTGQHRYAKRVLRGRS